MNRYRKLLDEYVQKNDFKLDPDKKGEDDDGSSENRRNKASKKKNTIVINPEYQGAYTGNY